MSSDACPPSRTLDDGKTPNFLQWALREIMLHLSDLVYILWSISVLCRDKAKYSPRFTAYASIESVSLIAFAYILENVVGAYLEPADSICHPDRAAALRSTPRRSVAALMTCVLGILAGELHYGNSQSRVIVAIVLPCTLLYPLVKRLPAAKPFYAVFAWLCATAQPFFLSAADYPSPTLAVFLCAVACHAFGWVCYNDEQDEIGDSMAGIKSIPVLLGRTRSARIRKTVTLFGALLGGLGVHWILFPVFVGTVPDGLLFWVESDRQATLGDSTKAVSEPCVGFCFWTTVGIVSAIFV